MSGHGTISIRSKRGLGVLASVTLTTVPLLVYSPLKDPIVYAFSTLFVGSMIAAFVPRLYAQIYARAVWWLSLLSLGAVGVLIQVSTLWEMGSLDTSSTGLATSAAFLGSLGALLCAGKSGLIQRSSLFDPKANRWPLTVSIIMGGADAMMLGLLAVAGLGKVYRTLGFDYVDRSNLGLGVSALVASLAMMVALSGVYRLRVWGVVMMLAVNSAVVVAGYAGWFVGEPGIVGSVFLATTLVQWLLASKLANLVRRGPLFEASTSAAQGARGVDTSEDGVTLDMSGDESHTVFEQEPVVQVAHMSASECV